MSQIICRDVTLAYDGRVVLDHINLEVSKGDYISIIGENGTGKTTFIKALLGLVRLSGGEITFGDGLEKNQIGYLPQQTVVQKDFPASVYEVVLSGCINRRGALPFYSKADRRRADEALKKINAYSLKKECFRELSGGQQQRVLIARALCATGQVLLLDEPTAALDPAASEELYRTVAQLNRELGVTVLLITHDSSAVTRDSNKILKLEGSGYEFMTTEEFLSRQKG